MKNSLEQHHPNIKTLLNALGRGEEVTVKLLCETHWVLQTPSPSGTPSKPSLAAALLTMGLLERFLTRIGAQPESSVQQRVRAHTDFLKARRSSSTSGRKPGKQDDGTEVKPLYLTLSAIRELSGDLEPLALLTKRGHRDYTLYANLGERHVPLLYLPRILLKNLDTKTRPTTVWSHFERFHLESSHPEVRKILATDLDALWEEVEAGQNLNGLVQKYFVSDKHDGFNMPFNDSGETWHAVSPYGYFAQLLTALAKLVLTNITQLLGKNANADDVQLSVELVLALAFHAGRQQDENRARNVILGELDATLKEVRIESITKTQIVKLLGRIVDRNLSGTGRIFTSSVISDDEETDWHADFAEAVASKLDGSRYLSQALPVKTQPKPKPQTLNPDVEFLDLFADAHYAFEFRNEWHVTASYETRAVRRVKPNGTVRFFKLRWPSSNIPNEVLEPRMLRLVTHPEYPAMSGTMYNDGETSGVQFDYPKAFQAGEIFATFYSTKNYYPHFTRERFNAVAGKTKKSPLLRFRLVHEEQYRVLTYRCVFPAWYPFKGLDAISSARFEFDSGLFFAHRADDLEHLGLHATDDHPYPTNDELKQYVSDHAVFMVCRLPDRLIVELHVRPDPLTGFVRPGRYGIVHERPSSEQLTHAFLEAQRQRMGSY
jgi:hypothetical protein